MSVTLSPLAGAGWQFFDNNGIPLSGGLLYTYAAGTSTPLATYTSSAGNVANSNPIVLDSAGRVSNEIWLIASSSYKFVLQNANATQIWTKDNITSIDNASQIFYNQGSANAITETVQSKLQQTVSVKDFGAVGDGSTDDTTAIQNALQYGCNTQTAIYVPRGTYLLNSQVSVTLQGYADQGSLEVYGDGEFASQFLVATTNTTGAILVTGTDNTVNVTFKYLGFASQIDETNSTALNNPNGVALWITGIAKGNTGFGSHNTNSVIIDHVFVGGYGSGSGNFNTHGSWSKAIEIDNMWYPLITNCMINGVTSTAGFTYPRTLGINIAGIELNRCFSPYVDMCKVFGYWDYGIHHHGTDTTGNAEQGGSVSNTMLVNQNQGLVINHSNTTPPFPQHSGFQVLNCHLNSNSFNLFISENREILISNTYLFAPYYAHTNPATVNGVATVGTIVGGSSYTNGTYTNVALTGGTGKNAYATVVVSGNAVTSVTITGYGYGGYVVGDTLSAANTDLGGTGSGFTCTVATLSTVPSSVYLTDVTDTVFTGCAFYEPGVYTSNTNATACITIGGDCGAGIIIGNTEITAGGIGIINSNSSPVNGFGLQINRFDSPLWATQVPVIDFSGTLLWDGGSTGLGAQSRFLNSAWTANTNAPNYILNSSRSDYATNTTGQGGAIYMAGLNSAGVSKNQGVFAANWSNNTSGSETSQALIYVNTGNTLTSALAINGSTSKVQIPSSWSYNIGANVGIYAGSGNPNGVVTAYAGSIYLNSAGGSGTTLYVKESGANTNTGWVGK